MSGAKFDQKSKLAPGITWCEYWLSVELVLDARSATFDQESQMLRLLQIPLFGATSNLEYFSKFFTPTEFITGANFDPQWSAHMHLAQLTYICIYIYIYVYESGATPDSFCVRFIFVNLIRPGRTR